MGKTKTGFDIKDLFKNTKKFSDDLVFDLGDGASMTLGELRAYDTEVGGSLQADLKKLNEDRAKVGKAAEEVAQLYLKLEDEKAKLAKPSVNNGGGDDPFAGMENDPLAAYVKSMTTEHKKSTEALQAKIDKLEKSLGEAGRTYINDFARNQFDSLRQDPDFDKDFTVDGLFDYAVKQGIKRSDGIPDLKRAYDQLVSPKRTERLVREAREAGKKEAEDEQRRAAFMPPPNSPGSRSITPRDAARGNPDGPPRSIREAVARAATDPTIFGFDSGGNA